MHYLLQAIKPGAETPAHIGRDTLAFMFETHLTPRVTPSAMGSPCIDRDYYKCWRGLASHFDPHWSLHVAAAAGDSGAGAEAENQ